MRRLSALLLGVFMSLSFLTKADEGMWLPILINQNMGTMNEMGLQLTAEELFSINNSSVKDAIVALDHGSCTGELISGEGLVLTNHHCAYGEIQSHSSEEHNYLDDGFWAYSKDQELPNPGKTMSFLVRVEDVSKKILAAVPASATQAERNKIVDSVANVLIDETIKDTHYEADVESMFKGNFYYLFVYETFRDIRLVGAPPQTIGKFGSDTDNWMWPRHTGDFSLFRIYAGPDGKPADYSKDNVPHKPKHFLPISLDGYEMGDFAFVMGYPGRTQRYMTSYELGYTMNYENPNRADIRGLKQSIWKKDMDKDVNVRIKYSSKYARSANYWKYSIEQNKALKKLDVMGQKQELEKGFNAWVNENEARKAKYGKALGLIEESINTTTEPDAARQYLLETHLFGAESFYFAFRASGLMAALQTPDSTERIKKATEAYKITAKEFFKDYNAETDKKATKALLEKFIADVDAKYYPSYINDVLMKKYKGNVEKFVNDVFKKSIFVDEAKLNAFLENPTAKAMGKDLAFMAGSSVVGQLRAFGGMTQEAGLKFQEGMRLFVAGLLEWQPETAWAPDANSTMRLTYGTVGDYYPADAVHYSHFTTMKGIMEKEDPDVLEFNVPEKLKNLYKNKDFGRYGNEDGTMNVCFTTNNDITGGNSGSPVINARGELIGTAFDGNSEAMSGDIKFENTMQKCINVDIRYTLFIIDKFAGAQNLIDEMKIVKREPLKSEKPAAEEAPVEMEMAE